MSCGGGSCSREELRCEYALLRRSVGGKPWCGHCGARNEERILSTHNEFGARRVPLKKEHVFFALCKRSKQTPILDEADAVDHGSADRLQHRHREADASELRIVLENFKDR